MQVTKEGISRYERRYRAVLEKVVERAKKHPGQTVPIGRLPNYGLHVVLMKVTRCSGIGPFRWSKGQQGYWFLSYEGA